MLQALFSIFGLFVCRSEHVNQPQQPHKREGPGWAIIVGFTVVFLATYPLHMYVSEVYLADNVYSFEFLLAKYCLGFLYLLFVPLVTLTLQREIRSGIATVFGSAATCNLDTHGEAGGQQLMPLQRQTLTGTSTTMVTSNSLARVAVAD